MTTGLQLPDEIRRFILTSIPSVPHLEALLLMRNEPGPWNAATLSCRLYMMNARVAVGVLADLRRVGLLCCEGQASGHYCYAPASDELRGLVDRLADVYSRHLVAVSHLIHSGSKTATRTRAGDEMFSS
jgi:hypothetical protein